MTFEEISTKYPVGKLLYRKINKIRRLAFWYSEQDKRIYQAKYPDAEFAANGSVVYTDTSVSEKRVEGWLFDGTEWHVVEDSWDGWVPLDQEDLDNYEKIGIAAEEAFSF